MGLIALIVFLLILAVVLVKFWIGLTFSKANLTFFGVCVGAAFIYLAATGQLSK